MASVFKAKDLIEAMGNPAAIDNNIFVPARMMIS